MYNSYEGKLRTNSNIAWHRPQSTSCRVEEELMQKSHRALETATDPLERLRLLCFSHGAVGIMILARALRKMKEHEDDKLTKEEFKTGIKETGMELSSKEAEELFDRFDTENTGTISLDEFLKHIRPPMSGNRLAIVEQAFQKLDRTGKGIASVEDIKKMYSVQSNPRYKSGEETNDTILTKFLSHFEQDGIAAADGKVTRNDFLNYYSGISASVDNDCFFDLMMRQAYKL